MHCAYILQLRDITSDVTSSCMQTAWNYSRLILDIVFIPSRGEGNKIGPVFVCVCVCLAVKALEPNQGLYSLTRCGEFLTLIRVGIL